VTGFIDVPYAYNRDKVATDALTYMAGRIPNWVPADGNPEVVLVTTLSALVEKLAFVVSQVTPEAFKRFGQSLMNIAPVNAAKAQATSTWTMIDNQGYTIPAGTVVAFKATGDQLVPFQVLTTVTVAPGSTVTATNGVVLEALTAGADANVVTTNAVLVDSLAYVASITAVAPTGGADSESDSDYLNRLSDELALMTPRPVLASDFSVLARRVPGVFRAIAIDNYNPQDGTFTNARMVTLAMVDAAGAAVNGSVKTAVSDYLESLRETGFRINTVDPTYFPVTVLYQVTIKKGFDGLAVKASINDALTSYFSPAAWGRDPDSIAPTWLASATTIWYLEVAQIVNGTAGVDRVASLSINNQAGDVPLTGVAVLTNPVSIDGSIIP
jgi:hypothetical protein